MLQVLDVGRPEKGRVSASEVDKGRGWWLDVGVVVIVRLQVVVVVVFSVVAVTALNLVIHLSLTRSFRDSSSLVDRERDLGWTQNVQSGVATGTRYACLLSHTAARRRMYAFLRDCG